MIRQRTYKRLRILVLLVIFLNMVTFIGSFWMVEELPYLHVPMIIGCLSSLFTVGYTSVCQITCRRVNFYVTLKLIILVLVVANLILSLVGVEFAGLAFVVIVPLFILPDLHILCNVRKLR